MAVGGCSTIGGSRAPRVSPNSKMNIAAIGCGGKGSSDIWECRDENVVALCDVDEDMGMRMFELFPDAKRYKDFREMLDKHPEIDGVTVSTPDHTHTIAALTAMEMGKHVYVQKPLTHNIREARLMAKAARKYGVVTQMGNIPLVAVPVNWR